MSQLSISVLGAVSVTLDGCPVTLPRRAVALLAYVAVESRRAHRREDLAALLWPDSSETKGLHNLRQALTALRRALRLDRNGGPFLRTTREAVAFERGSNYRLDLQEMAAPFDCPVSNEGRRLCRSECSTRAALRRGLFLGDVSMPESEAFSHWAMVQREVADRIAGQLLARLRACYADEDKGAAMPILRRQIEVDPWNEAVHRELMRQLSASGETNAAILHYGALAERLRTELGVEPEDETTALCETLRRKRATRVRRCVLVIQKDPRLRERIATFLRGSGYDVREAASTRQGRAILGREAADVALIDVAPGNDDGLALAAELRRASDIGIIFVSGRGSYRDRIAGLDAGGDDYLVKPVHLPELAARLRSVLRRCG